MRQTAWAMQGLILCAVLVAFYRAGTFDFLRPKLPVIDVPNHPAPSDNGWDALASAAARVDTHSSAIHAAWDAEVGSVPPMPAEVTEILADAREALRNECVHAHPPGQLHDLPYADDMRRLVRMMVLEARRLEGSGEHGEAARIYVDGLRVGPVVARNGGVIDWLSGGAITSIVTPDLSRCIGSGEMERADLEWLIEALATRERDVVQFHEALAIEWVVLDQEYADMAAGEARDGERMGWGAAVITEPVRRGLHKGLAKAIESAKDPTRVGPLELRKTGSMMADMLLQVHTESASRGPQRQAMLTGLRVHAAAQLHRLQTGEFPASLDELQLAPPATDPHTHGPMLYELRDDGYVVYSAGPDRVDDGGTLRLHRQTREGDLIIWPAGGTVRPREKKPAAAPPPG